MELLPSRDAGTGLAAMQRQMNRLLEDFLGQPFGHVAGRAGWGPAVDVAETEDSILVHVEIPGVDPKEVEISVTGEELTLRGEKRDTREESGRSWHRVERRHGTFVRSITLPAPVDVDRVDASARDGVLTVSLPKSADARPRRIEVKAV